MPKFKKYLYDLATDRRRGVFASLLKFGLFVLSLIYGLIVRLLAAINLARPKRLDPKIISVGNITLGGTGKTTLVEYIARLLKQKGSRVAIISRGYKRRPEGDLGDEPYMLSINLKGVPVLAGPDRIGLIKKAAREHSAKTIILDDAFQQWKIKKDLEIVAIDAASFLGNKHMIPRGVLREPVSALRRADVFALTKTDLTGDIRGAEEMLSGLNPRALIIHCIHQPIGLYKITTPENLESMGILRGKKIAALSGIGDPDSFEKLLNNLGAYIGLSLQYPDHHDYQNRELVEIAQKTKAANIDTVITTQKDAARLSGLHAETIGVQILVLRIELKITKNEKDFHSRLL